MSGPTKSCTKCNCVKSLDEFHRSGKASDGHASWCKQCTNSIARGVRKRNYSPENKRKWQLKTRYDLTPSQYDELRSSQNGKCAICGGDHKKLLVDHDHNTGDVRGLLCHKCNIRLGGWDDIEWRKSAMAYLKLNDNTPLAEAA